MGDVIPMSEKASPAHIVSEESYFRFLTEEGLELLALYRDIADPAVRLSILDMVRVLARVHADPATASVPQI